MSTGGFDGPREQAEEISSAAAGEDIDLIGQVLKSVDFQEVVDMA